MGEHRNFTEGSPTMGIGGLPEEKVREGLDWMAIAAPVTLYTNALNALKELVAERDSAREWVKRIWATTEQEMWDEGNGPDSWALELKREYRRQLTECEVDRDRLAAALTLVVAMADNSPGDNFGYVPDIARAALAGETPDAWPDVDLDDGDV